MTVAQETPTLDNAAMLNSQFQLQRTEYLGGS